VSFRNATPARFQANTSPAFFPFPYNPVTLVSRAGKKRFCAISSEINQNAHGAHITALHHTTITTFASGKSFKKFLFRMRIPIRCQTVSNSKLEPAGPAAPYFPPLAMRN
jgi:hypothetical protein